ncbi:MAG: hypothetical protein JW772_02010, partial [Candidatus Diapherotrites archaeon]|nr:hypothetical protein [Candidatus Diapherotrites archaeon]
ILKYLESSEAKEKQTKMVLKKEVEKALQKAKHPEFDRRLFECSMIRQVEIIKGKPVVTLTVPFLHVPIREQLVQLIKKRVEDDTGAKAGIVVKEMSEEEKKVFGKVVKEVRGQQSK